MTDCRMLEAVFMRDWRVEAKRDGSGREPPEAEEEAVFPPLILRDRFWEADEAEEGCKLGSV